MRNERKKEGRKDCDGLKMFSLIFFLIIDHSGALELVSVGGPASGTLSVWCLTVNDLEAADKGGVGWGGQVVVGNRGWGSEVRWENTEVVKEVDFVVRRESLGTLLALISSLHWIYSDHIVPLAKCSSAA